MFILTRLERQLGGAGETTTAHGNNSFTAILKNQKRRRACRSPNANFYKRHHTTGAPSLDLREKVGGNESRMDAKDFRRIALSLEGAEEGSHHGQADFRVGGKIFATLAAEKQGYGNLMLTPEQQAAFVEELPEVFLPIHGGWGRNGATHVRLAVVSEDVLEGALRTAWKRRAEKNTKSGKKTNSRAKGARERKIRRKK